MTRRSFGSAPPRCYTQKQICELLLISRATFFAWKKNGTLPLISFRLGRTVRYHALPIDRLLASVGTQSNAARLPEPLEQLGER